MHVYVFIPLYTFYLIVFCLAFTLAVGLIGMYIFRASNSQKNDFRSNPADPKVNLVTIY